ncbi:MAG: hypothetical protein HN368_03845 [Spirochaetales bacterium]|jgi:hypothetical protein|nr:hypothetical protein [Spirochaetales bacterium]
MAHTISTISTETAHIIQLLNGGSINPPDAIDLLLKLALRSETVRDLEFIRIARETIVEVERKEQEHSRLNIVQEAQ